MVLKHYYIVNQFIVKLTFSRLCSKYVGVDDGVNLTLSCIAFILILSLGKFNTYGLIKSYYDESLLSK